MSEPSNAIPLFEALHDRLANLFHDSSIVAADDRAIIANSIEASPICGIESDSYSPNQQVVVSESRNGDGPEDCMARSFPDQTKILHFHGDNRQGTPLLETLGWMSTTPDCPRRVEIAGYLYG